MDASPVTHPHLTQATRAGLSVKRSLMAILTLSVGSFSLLAPSVLTEAAHAAQGQGREVNITAQKQSFDEAGNTQFTGNVRVRYKDVRIRSNLATVELDDSGEPGLATLFNRPKAKRLDPSGKQDDVEANQIKILLNRDVMRAEGDSVSYITTMAANPVTIHSTNQEFDNRTKTVRADGNVKVDYNETKIYSPKAVMWVGENGKAERAVFTGGSRMEKDQSQINSEKLTVMIESGNLLAEHNVKTRMKTDPKVPNDPTKVLIDSDFQQYDKASDTMLASGNVKILYGDYRAYGPKATFKMKNGEVDRILITGRGTMITNGRQVEADKIVITTNPKHFDAFGNVKSKFLQKAKPTAKPTSTTSSGDSSGSGKATPTSGASAGSNKPAPKDDYLD